jgi:hypothetical protein
MIATPGAWCRCDREREDLEAVAFSHKLLVVGIEIEVAMKVD